MARLEELFRPYRPIKSEPGGRRILASKDSRGSYDAATVSELREQAEAQGEPLQSMSVMVAGTTVYGKHYDLAVTAAGRSYAVLYSDDEPLVSHVATELQELSARAASYEREGIAYVPNATGTGLMPSLTTKGARRARWTGPFRDFLHDPRDGRYRLRGRRGSHRRTHPLARARRVGPGRCRRRAQTA